MSSWAHRYDLRPQRTFRTEPLRRRRDHISFLYTHTIHIRKYQTQRPADRTRRLPHLAHHDDTSRQPRTTKPPGTRPAPGGPQLGPTHDARTQTHRPTYPPSWLHTISAHLRSVSSSSRLDKRARTPLLRPPLAHATYTGSPPMTHRDPHQTRTRPHIAYQPVPEDYTRFANAQLLGASRASGTLSCACSPYVCPARLLLHRLATPASPESPPHPCPSRPC